MKQLYAYNSILSFVSIHWIKNENFECIIYFRCLRHWFLYLFHDFIGYSGWSWGGCSDNVMIGNKMAKEFLDAKESGRDAKALINLHNNKVGRVVSFHLHNINFRQIYISFG